MKITKNMYYEHTWESDELYLYTVNTENLYTGFAVPAIYNLHKKYLNGTFCKDKAIVMFYRMATTAAKQYQTEIDPSVQFSVTTRWTTACDLLDFYLEDIEKGI